MKIERILKRMIIFLQSLSPGIVDSDFIRASGYAGSEATPTMFDETPKLKPDGEVL